MKETNMEHFRSEIEEMRYAFAVIDGEIKSCDDTACNDCAFRGKCMQNMNKWLMSEYKAEPVLTTREKHFVEFAQEGWLARDLKYNCFYWFKEKPTKYNDEWCCECPTWLLNSKFFEGLFPFITWEDENPWSIEELRKLKVRDED